MRMILPIMLALAVLVACTPPQTADTTAPVPVETQEANVEQEKLAAPVFAVEKVSGGEFNLATSIEEGRPAVVYFMASWCSKCAQNWEALNEVYPAYQDRVDFIAISVDPTDSSDVLEQLAADKGFLFETSPGNPELAVEYDVLKQTAKFAIDSEGNIVERHDGVMTVEEWDAFFGQLV